ncbi:MAG TPA: hypothetical protein VNO31_40930, partial [Umezawaea sp.]|nr:hypothetical protein [Umezawaea sp.]
MEGLIVGSSDSDPGGPVLPSDVAQCLDDSSKSAYLDERFVEHIRERGFTTPVWEAFRTRLVVYGFGFVTPLIESGAIFARCRRRGLRLHQQVVLPADAEELAMDVVVDGFDLFTERGIVAKQWSAASGMTLRRYFENACVLSFPNVYRRWQRSRREWKDVQLLDAWSGIERYMTGRSPEDAVVARAAVDALFDHVGEDARAVLFLADQN